jgi:hypothetical protein
VGWTSYGDLETSSEITDLEKGKRTGRSKVEEYEVA